MRAGKWLALAALAALVVAAGLSRVRFEIEILRMLPANLPQVEGLRIFLKHFARPDELIVTVEAPSADDAAVATAAISSALRARPDLIERATDRGPWEERPSDLAEIAAYLLLNAPPDRVREATARMLPDAAARTLRDSRERLENSLDPREISRLGYDPFMLTSAIEGLEKLADGRPGEFSSTDGTFRVIYVDAAPDLRDYRHAIKWVAEVETLARKAGQVASAKIEVTGEPAFMAEISRGMQGDMVSSAGLTMAIIGLIFWIAYRRIRALAMLWSMLLLVFVLTLGVAGFLLKEMTVIGIGFAAIMIGLSVDYGYLIFSEWSGNGGNAATLRRNCWRPICWSSLTTAAVFFALNASSLPGLSQLGNLVGLGTVIGAAIMLSLYASLVSRLPRRTPTESALGRVAWSPTGRRVGAWLAGALVVALTVALIMRGSPPIDATMRAFRPVYSPVYEALDRLTAKLSDENGLLSLVIVGASEDEVLARIVKAEEKLAALKEAGLLEWSVAPRALWPNTANQRENAQGLGSLSESSARLQSDLATAGFSDDAFRFTGGLLSQWSEWKSRPLPLWPENESSQWILRRVASHKAGMWVAGGLAKAVPGKEPALLDFQSEGAFLVNWNLLGSQLMRQVPREFLMIIGIIIVLLIGFLAAAYRNLVDVFLIASSMTLVLVSLAGAMSLLGLEWNAFNIAAILLLLGTGVDYSMNMILMLRRDGSVRGQRAMGKVIALCALSAAAGFGSITWASNYGLASLGRTAALGLAIDALVSVCLLPVAWRVLHRWKPDPHRGG